MLCMKWTTSNLTSSVFFCDVYSWKVMGSHSKSTFERPLKCSGRFAAFSRNVDSIPLSGSMTRLTIEIVSPSFRRILLKAFWGWCHFHPLRCRHWEHEMATRLKLDLQGDQKFLSWQREQYGLGRILKSHSPVVLKPQRFETSGSWLLSVLRLGSCSSFYESSGMSNATKIELIELVRASIRRYVQGKWQSI